MEFAGVSGEMTTFPAHMPLAMAYVPFQKIQSVYEPMNALMRGTIFPELDKPWLDGKAFTKMNNDMGYDMTNTGVMGESMLGRGLEK